jgi:hypothetical protein
MSHPATISFGEYESPIRTGGKHAAAAKPIMRSARRGSEQLWDTSVNNHNPVFDSKGRRWSAATIRDHNNPDFCKKSSSHPSAKLMPLERSSRQAFGLIRP